MGKKPILEIIRQWIGGMSFRVFLWSIRMSEEQYWQEVWEKEEDKKKIDELMGKGHSYHCATRQVWGDGECECDLYPNYNPYKWMKNIGEDP